MFIKNEEREREREREEGEKIDHMESKRGFLLIIEKQLKIANK